MASQPTITPQENGGSPKQVGKRKWGSAEPGSASFSSNSNHAQQTTYLTKETASRLLQVLELLDVKLLNTNLVASVGPSKAATAGYSTLREALESPKPTSIETLRELVSEVLSTLNAQNPPLPDLPPQPEGSHRKRTIDEEEELLLAQSARIETADRADAAREARERWRAQVMLVLDQVESALTQQHSVPDTTTTSASTPESDLKRKRSTRQSKGNLASMPLVPSQDIANPLQKIVLHRALLNSVDLFGSSGDLTLQDVMNDSALQSQLRKLPDTDVVGVQSLEGSTHLRQPAPTLGQISLPPHPPPAGARDLSRQPDPKPVLNLYFDPFSSFAPTYDSTDANLSYTASAHWSSSQEQAVAWQKESLLAKVYAEDVEASKQAASLQVKEKPTELESLDMNVDEALASHLGLESKAQLEQLLLYAPSSHDGATDATLRSISTALLDLQLGQLDRLRRSALQLRVLPTSAMHATNGQPTSVKLSELEAAQAAEVLEKLTQLAAAVRPKDLTPPSSKDPSSSSLARALKAPLLEAKDDRATPPPSFSGTLPPAQQATVLRESLLTRVGSSAKRSQK